MDDTIQFDITEATAGSGETLEVPASLDLIGSVNLGCAPAIAAHRR